MKEQQAGGAIKTEGTTREVVVESSADMVHEVYRRLQKRVDEYREVSSKPMTLAEKILVSHSVQPLTAPLSESEFCYLQPDRLAMQDATAQMALLQFMQSQQEQVQLASTVHCDHLILAHTGAAADMKQAHDDHHEVYSFLQTACEKYGIGFWAPGSGIIHQIVLENYAFPGGLMIGTDSHTPNAGGLGMVAVGVGGADAVDAMVGMPWELARPKVVAVELHGRLSGWTSPKDVILKVLEQLTVKGGKDIIFEYIGVGAQLISCTGKATITNMGAELGATTSLFPYDYEMEYYLKATGRKDIAALSNLYKDYLRPDDEVLRYSKDYYDDVLTIDLSSLKPLIVGPHSPDVVRPVEEMAEDVKKHGYPDRIAAALIGSCTNSSYEDIHKAASVAQELLDHGMRASVPFYITPGSTTVYKTVEKEGLFSILEKFGGVVLANACGPCIGQWKRDDIKPGEENSIVTSFNRNFRGRNDANKATLGFITSPELVVAYAASGSLSFNPERAFTSVDGKKVRITPPSPQALPVMGGLELCVEGYYPPSEEGHKAQVQVSLTSERLQVLQPFAPWDGEDFKEHRLLFKAYGKCTTDHISPAGRWLRYRGHLDRISDNLLYGATCAFTKAVGQTKNFLLADAPLENCAKVARAYQKAGVRWVIVGGENYGEGSSREHAAMTPRFLGASCVIVQSFARIHATNLKKQGVLALTFATASDYDKARENDGVSIHGLQAMAPGKPLAATFHHGDGGVDEVELAHSYNADQIQWFRAGSALNALDKK